MYIQDLVRNISSIIILVYICRRIENPRIVLLDCSLEYKKGESQVQFPNLM